MPVKEAAEPPSFDDDVRVPGNRALDELIGRVPTVRRAGRPRKNEGKYSAETDIPAGELPDLWTRALPALRSAYNHTCAYLGLRIDEATGTATVDHFIHKAHDRRKAYEWSNFRLAAHRVNTLKGQKDVLDPFMIEEGWFALDLATYEIVPGGQPSDPHWARVVQTIEALQLNNETFIATRRRLCLRYMGFSFKDEDEDEDRNEDEAKTTPWSLSDLRYYAPFLADQLRRQRRLNPGDT
jgi:5-methylcytosine-specific restriction endonuclease McrA